MEPGFGVPKGGGLLLRHHLVGSTLLPYNEIFCNAGLSQVDAHNEPYGTAGDKYPLKCPSLIGHVDSNVEERGGKGC